MGEVHIVSLVFRQLMSSLYSSAGTQADYFKVGLTNKPPTTVNPTVLSYVLCGQWPRTAFHGQPMFVQCQTSLPPVRYVVIISGVVNNYLTVCEVQVYGRGILAGSFGVYL